MKDLLQGFADRVEIVKGARIRPEGDEHIHVAGPVFLAPGDRAEDPETQNTGRLKAAADGANGALKHGIQSAAEDPPH